MNAAVIGQHEWTPVTLWTEAICKSGFSSLESCGPWSYSLLLTLSLIWLEWLLERLANNFEKHQGFLFPHPHFSICSLELFGDHQRASCHVVQCTSQIVFCGALGVPQSSLGTRAWALSWWVLSAPPPKEALLFIFLHIAHILCKFYGRGGSTPQTN